MPRKPIGDRALSPAEKQARYRARKVSQQATLRAALDRILTEARTIHDAKRIAAEALKGDAQ